MNRLLWFTLGGITVFAATKTIITALHTEPKLPPDLEKIMKYRINLPEFESQTIESPEGDKDA